MAESKTVNVVQGGLPPPPYTGQPASAAGSAIQSQPGYTGQPAQLGYSNQPAQPSYPAESQHPDPARPGYPPQTVQPVQQTSTVMMQPGLTTQAIIVPAAPCPSSYIGLSIFACLCCNCLLGMIAIIYSTKVESAYDQGDYEGARRNSNIAKWINIISIILGIGFIVYITISIAAV